MIGILIDKPTDPFMMLVTSDEHFDNYSAFATPNFLHTVTGSYYVSSTHTLAIRHTWKYVGLHRYIHTYIHT